MIFLILLVTLNIPFVLAQDLYATLNGQEIFIPKLGSQKSLSSHPRFNGVIQELFNRPGDYHGPNCYNTALIANGLFPKANKRYVSPQEFEAVLEKNFIKVASPLYGDLLVYDAKSSRGHTAFYLGDGLIFHKKSFGTQYHYRITKVENAGIVEENEWSPGPMDDSTAQMNWPEVGKLPKEYYRRASSRINLKIDARFASLIQKIELALVSDLKSWGIGRKWGIMGEYFLEDLLDYARKARTDKYTEGLILSLKEQVYVMLEEVYFKRARDASKVFEEICVPEHKEQLFDLIYEFGKLMNKDKQIIVQALNQLNDQDRASCRLRPITVL